MQKDASMLQLNIGEERVIAVKSSQKNRSKNKIEDHLECYGTKILDEETREKKRKKRVKRKQVPFDLAGEMGEQKDYEMRRMGIQNSLSKTSSLRESNETIISSNQSLQLSKISPVRKNKQNEGTDLKYQTINEDLIESKKKQSIPQYGEVSVSNTKCSIKYLFRAGTALLFLECSILTIIPHSILLTPLICLILLYLLLPFYYMIKTIILASSEPVSQTFPTLSQHPIMLITPYHPNHPIQQISYCNSCQIYKTSKIYHCSRCSVCHFSFDHYCSWLGACIFQKNYQMFFRFLISICLLFFILLGLDILGLIITASREKQAELTSYKTIIEILLSISLIQASFSEGFICYVLIHQIWVRSKGITTKQYFRGDMDIPGNNFLCDSFCYSHQKIEKIQENSEREQSDLGRKMKIEELGSNASILTRYGKSGENRGKKLKDGRTEKLDLIRLKPIIVDKNFVERKSQGEEVQSRYLDEQFSPHENIKPRLLVDEGEGKILEDTIDFIQSKVVKITKKSTDDIKDQHNQFREEQQ